MSTPKTSTHSYAVQQRLRLIDFLLANYGKVNRSAVMDFFGISTPQASADFKEYMAIAPENMEYDSSARTYVRRSTFKRIYS